MPTKTAFQPVRLSCLHYIEDNLLRIYPSDQLVIVGVEYCTGESGQPRVTDILIVVAREQLNRRDEGELLTLLPKQMKHAILNIVRNNEKNTATPFSSSRYQTASN